MLRERLVGLTPRERAQALRIPSFRDFLDSRVEKLHWPLILLIATVLLLLSQLVIPRDAAATTARLRTKTVVTPLSMPQATPGAAAKTGTSAELEEQLMGCRTLKTDPIPAVDKSPSLRVLETHTPQQRQQAQQYTAAVGACTDFACLRQANQLPRAPGQFPFPHFLVIGFPKCATSSLYCHLIQHPQIQHPKEKESHLLLDQCERPGLDCPAEAQRHYVVDVLNLAEAAQSQFTRAAFEGSTHYVLEADWFAERLAATMPWLRVVVSMRDPISQAIAMHLHNIAHGRPANCTADLEEKSIYHCVRRSLKARSHYAPKIEKWMKAFPRREQLHILQFENLTRPEAMAGQLQGLKTFLDLKPLLPSSELPLTNYKHQRGDEDALGRYWIMKRWEIEHLVSIARNSTMDLLDLLVQHGYAGEQGKAEWLQNWENIWQDNLSRCEPGRSAPCKVVVS
ncbi:hypothetical protein CHLNCDRAFT_142285 [Chlorella variabilis]|uniref:Sulfotransferase n=1 Tax=Chlorella variabilis TaxID=554065 RepID=E1Z877_CHLVA|nr:hypothetical protein CHLNCDRAFT_142285 [Chlorella variabilis]EFN58048.1 hypothetical protein CHLNCDRAFT_142285 [Chlorella variabilis]|eukprot:XP_005850150.1 hypothetical protein CHLNCDRAFT_142285 [Chlorella variabilis]